MSYAVKSPVFHVGRRAFLARFVAYYGSPLILLFLYTIVTYASALVLQKTRNIGIGGHVGSCGSGKI